MAEHPNTGLVRRGYEAFAKGDVATATELFSKDIVWHVPGSGPLCGDHVGRDAVFAVFGKMAELSGDFRAEVHDILANDEHAVALTRSVGSRQGKQLNMPNVDVWHIREGKFTEFWSFAMDQRAEDEFWS
jgi:ketosteroid isomerase-like protein